MRTTSIESLKDWVKKRINLSSDALYDIVALSSVSVAFFLFHWEFLFANKLILSHDSTPRYISAIFLSDSLAKGVVPYWNPYIHSGEPFYFLFPYLYLLDWTFISAVLVNLVVKASPLTLANYVFAFHVLIFGYGCYFFFRYIFRHRLSALIAFIVVLFSSLVIDAFHQQVVLVSSLWLPWTCLFLLKAFQEKRPRDAYIAAFFIGLSITYGYFAFFAFFLFVFVASFLLAKVSPQPLSLFLSSKETVPLMALIILLLASPVLELYSHQGEILPLGRVLSGSKVDEGISMAFDRWEDFNGSSSRTHWPDLLGLILPNLYPNAFNAWEGSWPFSEVVLYIGILPLVFAFIGIVFGNSKYRFHLLLSLLLMLCIMSGKATFLYYMANYLFPGFGTVRHVQHFAAYFLFLLCCFVGVGVDTLLDYSQERGRDHLRTLVRFVFALCIADVLLVLFIAVGMMFVVFYVRHMSLAFENLLTPFVVNILAFTGTAFFFHIFRDDAYSLYVKKLLLVCFILLDLFHFDYNLLHYYTHPRDDGHLLSGYTSEFKFDPYRKASVPRCFPDPPIGKLREQPGIPTVQGYEPLVLKEFTAGFPQEIFGSSWWYTLKGYYLFRSVCQNPDNMLGIKHPKLFVARKAVVDNRENLMGLINSVDEEVYKKVLFIEGTGIPEGFSHLILQPSEVSSYNEKEVEASFKVLDFNLNRLVVWVDTPVDGFLYYSDGYHKDWRAAVDGKESEIYKTNLAFKSLIIPAGTHTVSLEYNPRYFRMTLWLHSLTFFGFIGYVLFPMRKIFR